jgi:polyisoprenoid-binding protein YceI
MRLAFLCWIFASFFVHSALAQSYVVDVEKSRISWTGWKQLFGNTVTKKGILNFKSGSVSMREGTSINAVMTMDMNSLANVDEGKVYKDNEVITHLKSESCLFVEKYPEAVFRLTTAKTETSGSDRAAVLVTGTLTIKGITRPLSFPAEITKTGRELAIAATFQISRKAYNLDLEPFLIRIGGDKMVRDNIDVTVQILTKTNH